MRNMTCGKSGTILRRRMEPRIKNALLNIG
jgi:hypothetical protein